MLSHFLIELDAARLLHEGAEATDTRSRMAAEESECVVVAMHKELEDALARADGVVVQLQATEAKRAKAKAAAKAFAEATAALLGQLQEARA